MIFNQYRQTHGWTTAHRAACALAAFAVSATLCSAVLGLFAYASSAPWLPATPEAMALASACERLLPGSGRAQCMREAVAQWRASSHQEVRVASWTWPL